MTFDTEVAEAQALAAQLAAQGAPITLQGAPHSEKRIMFYHGATTGHASCTCPVVDEHGHNVNPGRAPLERQAAGRAEGSRKASETYARRRARKAADELAVIDPALWDDETRRIVTTLATLAAPSRIDDVLAGAMPVTLDELDRLVAHLDANGGTWDDMPDGTESLAEAFAADLHRMETVPRPEPRPYPQPRPRPDPDPRPRPEPHPNALTPEERASVAEAADRNAAAAADEPCQPIGCDNGIHLPGCTFAAIDADLDERHGLRVHDNGATRGYQCRFGHDHSTPDNAYACSMHDNGDYRA